MLYNFIWGHTTQPDPQGWFDQSITARPVSGLTELTQAYACDVHSAALATAVITSGINTLSRPSSTITPEQLQYHLDHVTGHGEFLKQAVLDILPEIDDLFAATEFLDRFRGARLVLDNYGSETAVLGESRARAVYWQILQQSWRETCRSARFALDELETILGPDLPPLYLQNHKVLAALLSGAAHGLSPCFNESGELYAPPLPQQRRWPRRAVLQDCVVVFGETNIKGYLRDASAGGLGLDHVPPLKTGVLVTIKMESGRALEGVVAWSRGSAAGVKFNIPLPANDPLLWG